MDCRRTSTERARAALRHAGGAGSTEGIKWNAPSYCAAKL